MNSKLIVIVDDDNEIRGLLRLILENAGYKVLDARDSSSAFSILSENIPDLILLDVMLPEKDGFEMCKEIKANPVLSFVPVVFVTAYTTMEALKKAVEVKAQGFLEKPIEPQEFIAQVEEVLKGHYSIPTHLKP